MQPRKESGLDSACNICILETGPGFNDKDVINTIFILIEFLQITTDYTASHTTKQRC